MTDTAESPATVALDIPGLAHSLQLRVHARGDRYISSRLRREGIWEPYETALLVAGLQPGDVFVDVGANLGYYSVLAASLVGAAGAVFAFEPEAANFQLLQENIRRNGFGDIVRPFELGLAEHGGPGSLYLSEDNAGDHQVFAAAPGRRRCAITLCNGSDFLRGRLRRLDWLKVDVQGAEFAVISGLLPLLRELAQLPRIILELTPLSLRQSGSSGRALMELLAALDQPLWIIDHIEHRLVASSGPELAQWCDDVDAVAGDAGFMNILVGPGLAGQ